DMSVEVAIYPPHASKQDLRRFLVEAGFSITKSLFEWPEEASHYFWYEDTDYQSTAGVEATIYRPSVEERYRYGGGDWAVHRRTRVERYTMRSCPSQLQQSSHSSPRSSSSSCDTTLRPVPSWVSKIEG